MLKPLNSNGWLQNCGRRKAASLTRIIAALIAILALFCVPVAEAHPFNPLPSQPGFAGGLVLSGAGVEYASPTAADLNGDGKKEIIIGGSDGMVYAVEANGHLLWSYDTAAAINPLVSHPGKSTISSAVAVGDLDNDGKPEVVVSVGAPATITGYNGGMVVLDNAGRLKPGWPRITCDQIGPNMSGPDGHIEGFYSSPAIGDLDGDGDLEIVVGGWDMRLYAWHSDGRLVDGWPRFVYDTVWSSPALADLDDDGRLEVIIGTDAALPHGGILHVLRGDASELPGFPKFIDQTIYSSPAVADINGDGSLDIVVGTGNFYPDKGYAIYAWDVQGNPLPGWPAATGGYVLSAPSVGDIDGDGRPEVVVGCNDGKVYAFHGDGRLVTGWPAIAYDNLGNVGPSNYSSPVLANFDADAQPEIFVNHYCDTIVYDGDGKLLTHVGNSGPSGKPSMYMFSAWCLGTTPVVMDIDGDNRLEIVRAGGQYDPSRGVIGHALIYAWESKQASVAASWPMYRQDPTHQTTYQPGKRFNARVVSHTLPSVMTAGESREVEITLENTGTQPWTASASFSLSAAADDTLTPGKRIALEVGESVAPGERATFEFQLHAPVQGGRYLTSWRMADGNGKWFGLAAYKDLKIGSEPSYYVLTKKNAPGPGGVYPGGLAPPLSLPKKYWNWNEVRSFAFLADGSGYQLLDYQGAVWQGGAASAPGGHGFVPDSQELLLSRDGTSYYILDRYGKLTRSAGAVEILPAQPSFANPVVRSGVLTPDGKGVYLLLADGSVRTGGNAAPFSGTPVLGGDVAKKIKLTSDGKGAYILDAYGRVWNIGTAPALKPQYTVHMNEDWARDIELTGFGRGYYLLDKEGRIYPGGNAVAPKVNLTPIWPGEDAAVDLVVTDSSTINALVVNPSAFAGITTASKPTKFVVKVDSTLDSVAWRVTANQPWLKFDAQVASTPGEVEITADPRGLPLGMHQATITITGDGAANSPLSIPVQLRIVDAFESVYLPLVLR